jgi:hypothetical protein
MRLQARRPARLAWLVSTARQGSKARSVAQVRPVQPVALVAMVAMVAGS